jgi:hypothetical protein
MEAIMHVYTPKNVHCCTAQNKLSYFSVFDDQLRLYSWISLKILLPRLMLNTPVKLWSMWERLRNTIRCWITIIDNLVEDFSVNVDEVASLAFRIEYDEQYWVFIGRPILLKMWSENSLGEAIAVSENNSIWLLIAILFSNCRMGGWQWHRRRLTIS